MSRSLSHRMMVLSLAGFAFACSGDDTDTDAGAADAAVDAGVADTGPADTGPADTGPADTGVVIPDAGMPDTGPGGDSNDGFDEAFDARKNTNNGFRAAIAEPGDRDYYFFEGTEGEYVRVFTNTAAAPNGDRVDTVIRIYDNAEVQVAENDDAVPRVSVDSEIIYRLPADGRYFVEVIEWSDWAEEALKGQPNFAYQLQVRTVNANNPGTTIETEAGNDAASAIPAVLNQNVGLICGTFADNADVDVYAFTQPAEGYLYFEMMPAGTDGHGATSPIGNVWLTDASGMDIMARLDMSGDTTNFSPAVPAGDYLLWLQHPGMAAGSNDFYSFKPLIIGGNDPEMEPNDSRATAEPRMLTARPDQMDRANFLLANLPDGDVDYFAVEPVGNETLTVVCGSATAGSGVQGLTIEIQDGTGATLAMATEPADDLARITDQTVTSSVVYVKISKTGQDPVVSGDFVRCGFFVNP